MLHCLSFPVNSVKQTQTCCSSKYTSCITLKSGGDIMLIPSPDRKTVVMLWLFCATSFVAFLQSENKVWIVTGDPLFTAQRVCDVEIEYRVGASAPATRHFLRCRNVEACQLLLLSDERYVQPGALTKAAKEKVDWLLRPVVKLRQRFYTCSNFQLSWGQTHRHLSYAISSLRRAKRNVE